MFWVLMYKDDMGKYWLYLCRADSIDRACTITGLRKEDISHCVISKDMLDHVSNIEAGYIRIEF